MDYNEFVGQVHNRARLASRGEAVQAINATLETLSERLTKEQADHLAAQLPQEIGNYLRQTKNNERFDLQQFFERIAEREPADLPEAVHHARAVISVLDEAVTPGEMKDVRSQLPEEYNKLFEAGSEGEM